MDTTFELTWDELTRFCERVKLQHRENRQRGQIGILTPLGQDFTIRVIPQQARNMLTLALPMPHVVPRDRIPEVARATALANSDLFMGAWGLNHANGELFFRMSVPMRGVSFSDHAMLFAFNTVFGTFRAFHPAFLRIIHDGEPAECVMTVIENRMRGATNPTNGSKEQQKSS